MEKDGRYNYQSSFFNGSNSLINKESNRINTLNPHSLSETTCSITPTPLLKSNTNEALEVTNNQKPRGRPRGSKNKQIQTEVKKIGLEPFFLRIQPGSDVISIVRKFSYENQVGVTILNGSGFVSNISFHEYMTHATPIKTFPGPFSIVSLTGTFTPFPSPSLDFSCCYFGIILAGTRGNIFGGIINGSVTAVTEVVLMVVTFKEAPIYKLPETNVGQKVEENYVAPTGCNGVNMDSQYPPEVVSSSQSLCPAPLSFPDNLMTWDSLSFQRLPY